MLFVAGEHAKNDMAGDEPGSLRSMLEAKGYPVECILRGLGELADVQNMYAEKVREARCCF
jgi:sirohydrochlorin cobaltochelatase